MNHAIHDLKMIFATNDPRFLHLKTELKKKIDVLYSSDYEPVSTINKYAAALLSFHPNRKVWWNKYQWHPLMQSGRRKKLNKSVQGAWNQFDALLMVGSWFQPFRRVEYNKPFFVYIDQSCNKVADKYDIQSKALNKARVRFNETQFIIYQHCQTIFCMSEWARKQTLEAHNIPDQKVIKVGWGPVGVNLLNDPITIDNQEPYILFVGHEFKRKGVDLLRAAIPAVIKEIPNVRFKVVGGNSDHLHIEPHPNLDLLGAVRNLNTMKELYRNATIFVLPHRFDRSPHVLLEAMSAGKPIITSCQGGAPEVVQESKNGFLIEVGDIEALSHHIVTLLKNRNMCLAFGEQGRNIMRSSYTWEAVASKMLSIIASKVQ